MADNMRHILTDKEAQAINNMSPMNQFLGIGTALQETQEWVKTVEDSGGGGGTNNHTQLTNRDAADQHPMSAITGLTQVLGTIPRVPTIWLCGNRLIGPKNTIVEVDLSLFTLPFPTTATILAVGDKVIDVGGHSGSVISIGAIKANININGFRGQESAEVGTFDFSTLSGLHILPGLTRLVQSFDEEYWVYNYQDAMFMGFGVALEGAAPNLIPRLHTFITTAAGEIDDAYAKVSEVTAAITALQSAIDGKQPTLTAGTNVNITANVISAVVPESHIYQHIITKEDYAGLPGIDSLTFNFQISPTTQQPPFANLWEIAAYMIAQGIFQIACSGDWKVGATTSNITAVYAEANTIVFQNTLENILTIQKADALNIALASGTEEVVLPFTVTTTDPDNTYTKAQSDALYASKQITLIDNPADATEVAAGEIATSTWLQKIKDNLKALFSYFTSGLLNIANGGTGAATALAAQQALTQNFGVQTTSSIQGVLLSIPISMGSIFTGSLLISIMYINSSYCGQIRIDFSLNKNNSMTSSATLVYNTTSTPITTMYRSYDGFYTYGFFKFAPISITALHAEVVGLVGAAGTTGGTPLKPAFVIPTTTTNQTPPGSSVEAYTLKSAFDINAALLALPVVS
jgi:hypothetical protein